MPCHVPRQWHADAIGLPVCTVTPQGLRLGRQSLAATGSVTTGSGRVYHDRRDDHCQTVATGTAVTLSQ